MLQKCNIRLKDIVEKIVIKKLIKFIEDTKMQHILNVNIK